MPYPLVEQRFALPHRAAAVFVLRIGHPKHGANSRLAALIGQQGPNQCLAINPVGLCAPPPARRRNGCRVDDIALNAFALENPVYPETIQASLVNRYNPEALSGASFCLTLKIPKTRQQGWNIASVNVELRHLPAGTWRYRCDQPL